MNKIVLVIACTLLQGCISLAVSPEVTGTVMDESGDPLNANVTITNIQLQKFESVGTDEMGNYSFKKMRIWVFPIFSAIFLRSEVSVQAKGYKAESKIIDSRNSAIVNFNLVAE
ncbi:carboxypeptidase-like regulatory domain-containing protein [Reinekea sp. G2M2-21]|uniref:carboxypeptidase-like regulatory domain-containing protein n=1 Tax=Reinekea sp. G2M2-21 TaxID=2788942 RepID=UPI0018AB0D16|nr:carboxypeptidase-like regulatory domain-containing protein [Reinekea sp. G2M2-21]